MIEDLERLVKQISDPALRDKVLDFVRKPSFKLGDLEGRFSISESPASVFRHHSYKHGLLEHTISVTMLGAKIDHISLMVSELNRREFPIEVIHAVAAHHAEFNVLHPTTLEALIVHVADIADSRLNGKILEAARHLIKEAMGERVKGLSLKDSLELLKIASEEGLSSVKRRLEEGMPSEDE